MSDLAELYKGCRTYRRFKQDPVPEELIAQILENCRIASCASNAQQNKVYAVVSKEKVEAINKLIRFAGYLPRELGDPKENEQPVAHIVLVRPAKCSPWSDIDLGILCETVAMTAWEGGFGSCIMGAINAAKIHDVLGLGDEDVVRVLLALGKPDHKSTLVDLPEDGSIKYYVDGNVDYYVPKRPMKDVGFIV